MADNRASRPKLLRNAGGTPKLDDDGSLPDPAEGWVWQQYPPYRKYFWEPGWYDTLGRDPLERRKVHSLPHAEQVSVYLELRKERPDMALDLIFRACVKGNDLAVRALLDSGMKPIAERGQDITLTPLHAACFNGNLNCVKVLIEEYGMDVNTKDENGSNAGATVLMRAAKGGHAGIVLHGDKGILTKLWPRHGSWSMAQTPPASKKSIPLETSAPTAFEYAAEGGNLEVIKLLSNHPGAKFTVTPKTILSCAQSRSEPMMKFLLEKAGYPVLSEDITSSVPWKGDELDTEQKEAILEAIPQATYTGSIAVLRLLLACLRPLPERRLLFHSLRYRRIALAIGIAAARGPLESLELLLDVGFDPTVSVDAKTAKELAKAREWFTDEALIQAARFGLLHVIDHLLQQRNARVSPSEVKATPLYRAAENGRAECVKKLLDDYHADIQVGCGRNRNGPTALWIATRNRQFETVDTLLRRGGPLESVDPSIETDSNRVFITAREGHRYPVDISKTPPSDGQPHIELGYADGIPWLEKLQLRKDDSLLMPGEKNKLKITHPCEFPLSNAKAEIPSPRDNSTNSDSDDEDEIDFSKAHFYLVPLDENRRFDEMFLRGPDRTRSISTGSESAGTQVEPSTALQLEQVVGQNTNTTP